MKIVLTKLPESGWWKRGIPKYLDNPAMKEGQVPNGIILNNERNTLMNTIKEEGYEILELEFPKQLDKGNPNHDFVFIRDPYISNQNGKVIILRAGEAKRRIENRIVKTLLEKLDVDLIEMPDKPGLRADGGEFFYCAKDKILFSGLQRNSQKGVDFVAQELDVDKVVLLKGTGFHLDTFFSPVLDKDGFIIALIICERMVDPISMKNLYQYADVNNITIFTIPEGDALGTEKKEGKFTANALSLPGVLIKPGYFSDPVIDEQLINLGISVKIAPTTQFQLSGGSIHCVTNEI